MQNKTIGILGTSGFVGHYAAEKVLEAGMKVIGGQRKNDHKLDQYKNYDYKYVDINTPETMDSFIRKCDVVVNCISPSHIYGKKIKDAVCRFNKIYIDPSDMSFEPDRDHTTGKCVTSCGYIPGLSEYLTNVLTKKYFDKLDRCVMCQGGFDGCSHGAFVDMIIGAGKSHFYGDSCILDSKIAPFLVDIRKKYNVPIINSKVLLKPLINSDSIHLQKVINAKEFYFFSSYDDFETLKFFMKLLIEVSKNDLDTAAGNINARLNERMETYQDFGNQDVTAFLLIELTGEKQEKEKNIVCTVRLKNVNKVCGYFLGETIKAVATETDKVKEGINYGMSIVDDSYLDELLLEIGNDEVIDIQEIQEKWNLEILTK